MSSKAPLNSPKNPAVASILDEEPNEDFGNAIFANEHVVQLVFEHVVLVVAELYQSCSALLEDATTLHCTASEE